MAKIFIEIDTTDPATMDLIREGVRIGSETFKEVADLLDECYDKNFGIVPMPYRDADGHAGMLTVGVMTKKDTTETEEMKAARKAERKYAEQMLVAMMGLDRKVGETVH